MKSESSRKPPREGAKLKEHTRWFKPVEPINERASSSGANKSASLLGDSGRIWQQDAESLIEQALELLKPELDTRYLIRGPMTLMPPDVGIAHAVMDDEDRKEIAAELNRLLEMEREVPVEGRVAAITDFMCTKYRIAPDLLRRVVKAIVLLKLADSTKQQQDEVKALNTLSDELEAHADIQPKKPDQAKVEALYQLCVETVRFFPAQEPICSAADTTNALFSKVVKAPKGSYNIVASTKKERAALIRSAMKKLGVGEEAAEAIMSFLARRLGNLLEGRHNELFGSTPIARRMAIASEWVKERRDKPGTYEGGWLVDIVSDVIAEYRLYESSKPAE
jgi:hypothetical protein